MGSFFGERIIFYYFFPIEKLICCMSFFSVSDDFGDLVMEVGIGRTLSFKYKNGDFIEALRSSPSVPSAKDQHLSIPLARWWKMRECEPAIRSQLKELFAGNPVEAKLHIGGLTFVQISSRYKNVQLRQHAMPTRGAKMFPTKFGVSMSLDEYFYFTKLVGEFTARLPDIDIIVPCYTREDHSSDCLECYPNRKSGPVGGEEAGLTLTPSI